MHIKNQIESGSDVVQIFDSWAGLLTNDNLQDFCFHPNYEIVNFCKNKKFQSFVFLKVLKKIFNFNKEVKPDVLNIDYEIDPIWAV